MSGKGIVLLALGAGAVYLLMNKTIGNIPVGHQIAQNAEFAGFSVSYSNGQLQSIVKIKVTNTSNNTMTITGLKVYIQALGSTIMTSIPTPEQLSKMVVAPQSQSTLAIPVSISITSALIAVAQLKSITSLNANAIIDIAGFPTIKLTNASVPFNGAALIDKAGNILQTVENGVSTADNSVSNFRQTIVSSAVNKYRQEHQDQTVTVYSSPGYFGLDTLATYYIQGIDDGGMYWTYKIGITGNLSTDGVSKDTVNGMQTEDL